MGSIPQEVPRTLQKDRGKDQGQSPMKYSELLWINKVFGGIQVEKLNFKVDNKISI